MQQTAFATGSTGFGAPVPNIAGATTRPAGRQPESALRSLQPIGVVSTHERGQAVFREGDPATHWYEMVSGAARTCKLLADGRRQIGEFLLPGDVFGFEVGASHTIDVETVGPASITRFSRARVRLLVETQPDLALRLQEVAFETVARAHARLLVLARQTAHERVAGFVLEMERRIARGGGPVTLPMTRQDIADYLCLTIETVCRVLADFKRERLIRTPSPHQVLVIDRDGLEDLGGM